MGISKISTKISLLISVGTSMEELHCYLFAIQVKLLNFLSQHITKGNFKQNQFGICFIRLLLSTVKSNQHIHPREKCTLHILVENKVLKSLIELHSLCFKETTLGRKIQLTQQQKQLNVLQMFLSHWFSATNIYIHQVQRQTINKIGKHLKRDRVI